MRRWIYRDAVGRKIDKDPTVPSLGKVGDTLQPENILNAKSARAYIFCISYCFSVYGDGTSAYFCAVISNLLFDAMPPITFHDATQVVNRSHAIKIFVISPVIVGR